MKNKDMIVPLIVGFVLTAVVAGIIFRLHPVGGILCVVLGTALLALFAVYTGKRYGAIRELNDYLSLVCSGH